LAAALSIQVNAEPFQIGSGPSFPASSNVPLIPEFPT
jgi:hypothetical protein